MKGFHRGEEDRENGRNHGEMIVFISCLSTAVPMETICDGKECKEGRLMPDWDALYLAKWLLIGLGEPRTRWSRYSFSLLKCLLNYIQTVAGPGCLRRGWRCVTCLTRLAGKGLSLLCSHAAASTGEKSSRTPGECPCLLTGRPPGSVHLSALDQDQAEPAPCEPGVPSTVRDAGLRARVRPDGSERPTARSPG